MGQVNHLKNFTRTRFYQTRFYGPLAPSVGVSGPSLNSLENYVNSLTQILKVSLKADITAFN